MQAEEGASLGQTLPKLQARKSAKGRGGAHSSPAVQIENMKKSNHHTNQGGLGSL